MPNTPTYILYHGKATGKDKAGKKIWTRIGAVWPNKSGKGFNLSWDPTLSTLSGRNLIKTADLFSKQAEDVDLHIVETFNEIMHLPLYRHSDAVNAFQQLENPTQGR